MRTSELELNVLLSKYLRKQDRAKTKPDWWQRARTICAFVSTVSVLAISLLALKVNSTLQGNLIASTEAASQAQVQLGQKELAANLAVRLLDDLRNPQATNREASLRLLKIFVPGDVYVSLLQLVATKDPQTELRQAAITQLAKSKDPRTTRTLQQISADGTRPHPERKLAKQAITTVLATADFSPRKVESSTSSSDSRDQRIAEAKREPAPKESANACDINSDQKVDDLDIQIAVSQVLGRQPVAIWTQTADVA